MGNIDEYYAGKRILVTGATGLVGRVLVEKILRDLPRIERLYVLLRSRTRGGRTVSASERLLQELFTSSAFDPLRQLHGPAFASLVEEKVVVVSGDMSKEYLGLDGETYWRLQEEIDLIINCAAVVSFDAPLDTAIQLNTLGPPRIMKFAQGCRSATVAHLSTCYVNGTKEGPIAEEPLDLQKVTAARNGGRRSSFDIDAEVASLDTLIKRINRGSTSPLRRAAFAAKAWFQWLTKRSAAADGVGPARERLQHEWVEKRLVIEGMGWAHRWGFNDTYTLTKAMGEELAMRHRGSVPTLVLRPSIIESALESPMPGWLDGMRMIDPLIVAYGRNLLPDFPGRADSILDIVPVDMVVNSLLAAIPSTQESNGPLVYHIASGMQNPLTLQGFADLVRDYYRRESPTVVQKQPHAFPRMTFPPTKRFLRRVRYRYMLPLRLLLGLTVLASITPWGRRLRSFYRAKRTAVDKLAHYARLYGPHAESRSQYMTHHTQAIWNSLSTKERGKFDFDIGRIDWRDYILNVHIPGLKKFVLGAATKDPRSTSQRHGVAVAETTAPALPHTATPRDNGMLVGSNGRAKGLGAEEGTASKTPERCERHTIHVPDDRELDHWIRSGELYSPARVVIRWGLEQFLRYYTGFQCEGAEHIPKSGPFIIAANHSSHLDTGALIVSLARAGKLHPLAARDYFFRNRLWEWAFHSFVDAAPFDRHSHTAESLGLAKGLLARKHSLLYFPEGGRSADGKMLPFKRGIGLLALESGAPVVPAFIQGSFQALPKGHSIPKRHLIHVRFGGPIDIEPYISSQNGEGHLELSRKVTEDIEAAVKALS